MIIKKGSYLNLTFQKGLHFYIYLENVTVSSNFQAVFSFTLESVTGSKPLQIISEIY